MSDYNLTFLIVILLAYSIVEFIYRDKLSILQRALVMIVIIIVDLFWRPVSLYHFLIAPIAAFSYTAISYLQSKASITEKGAEFRNLILNYLSHILTLGVIFIPFRENLHPTNTMIVYSGRLNVARWEIILLVLIANIFLAPRLIKALLNDLTFRTCQLKGGGDIKEHLTDDGAYQAGTIIGILERLLIIVSVLLTNSSMLNLSLIGFILGTKSLARFKKFDNQEFVEYFIVGTMASVLFALISIWSLQKFIF